MPDKERELTEVKAKAFDIQSGLTDQIQALQNQLALYNDLLGKIGDRLGVDKSTSTMQDLLNKLNELLEKTE